MREQYMYMRLNGALRTGLSPGVEMCAIIGS